MDAKVSHKPCPCPSFKILYILLELKPVQHLVRHYKNECIIGENFQILSVEQKNVLRKRKI
jgi:hypothetical protein